MSTLKAAAVFSNHMVLQMGKPINIWGHDYSGKLVKAELCGFLAEAICRDNEWHIILPPINAYGGPYELKITDGEETITFVDVMIGEVWIAGGQSNMELELQNEVHGAEELKKCASSNVRFYYTKKNPYIDEFFYIDERNSGWTCASEDASRCWSAVGYYFGKKLAA
ncbi:MAG: sialate O-acetylesterase, partial [Lachnospiraceae bacterium]|nr:sialate O-acetylesterase [Lachnospiraceae bacterium]